MPESRCPRSLGANQKAFRRPECFCFFLAIYASAYSSGHIPTLAACIRRATASSIDRSSNKMRLRKQTHPSAPLPTYRLTDGNTPVSYTHLLAHKTGAQFDIPHGRCNAILLPYVIEYNARAVPERMADIARALGLAGATSHQLTNSLVEAIKELNKKLGIKQSYCENGVSEENFLKVADFIAENATADPCTGSNPRATDTAAMRKILDLSLIHI